MTRYLVLAVCLSGSWAAIRQTEISSDAISPAAAQEIPTPPGQRLDAGVPPAALLTDRGRALVENLRNLRRTRANLGPKHPTLPVIEQAIFETEQQLRAWLPEEDADENPFKKLDSPSQRSGPAPGKKAVAENDTVAGRDTAAMNDTDLRQLVLRMHARIVALEKRVRVLERSQK